MSVCSGDTRVFGFHPHEVTEFARPVQVENATGGLCGAPLPDGRGILMWPLGTNVRFAIVDSPRRWVQNDVVTAPMVSTAVALGSGVILHRTSVYVIDGGLYCTVFYRDTTPNLVTAIYKADSPVAPSAWTLHSTVATAPDSGAFGSFTRVAGIPYRMASGRWVLPGSFGRSDGTTTVIDAGMWYSDDAGETWTLAFNRAHGFGGARTDSIPGQVACDPASGLLLWISGAIFFEQHSIWSSSNGASWTEHDVGAASAATRAWFPFNNVNRAVVFGNADTGSNAGSIRVPTGLPTSPSNWGPVVGRWFPAGQGGAGETRKMTAKAIVAPGGVYPFWLDRVSFMPAGGWSVGRIGF